MAARQPSADGDITCRYWIPQAALKPGSRAGRLVRRGSEKRGNEGGAQDDAQEGDSEQKLDL